MLLERAGQVAGRAVLTQLDEPARRHWRTLQLEASAEDVDALLACVEDVAREQGAQALQTTIAQDDESHFRARGWSELARVPGAFRGTDGEMADGVLLVLWLVS